MGANGLAIDHHGSAAAASAVAPETDPDAVPAQAVAGIFTRDFPRDGHECRTLDWLASEVARLGGLPYLGLRDAADAAGVVFIPDQTLLLDQVAPEARPHLLGGAVPQAWLGTKAVFHPLVPGCDVIPAGWQAMDAVHARTTLPGFTAFSPRDAIAAWRLLAGEGHRVRAKPTGISGGSGQVVCTTEADVDTLLARTTATDLAATGIVLEADLDHAETFSVGTIVLHGTTIAYFGEQHLTRDGRGEPAYGGSTLVAIRGGFDALARDDRAAAERDCIALALEFDRAVREAYPALEVSRCNYDVIRGTGARGEARVGLLEQSWRVGGATPAELAAFEALRADPTLQRVRACTRERYGAHEVPATAHVYFHGAAPDGTPLVKYRMVARDGGKTLPG